MTQETTIGWLKFGSALTIFFGALIAAATVPALSGPVQFLADFIFFPLDGLQSVAAEETRLINAIGGGVMVGWGVMLWMDGFYAALSEGTGACWQDHHEQHHCLVRH